MYQTMVFWKAASAGAHQSAEIRDFAELWRGTDKVVDSRTLQTVTSARAQIERGFRRRGRLLKGWRVATVTDQPFQTNAQAASRNDPGSHAAGTGPGGDRDGGESACDDSGPPPWSESLQLPHRVLSQCRLGDCSWRRSTRDSRSAWIDPRRHPVGIAIDALRLRSRAIAVWSSIAAWVPGQLGGCSVSAPKAGRSEEQRRRLAGADPSLAGGPAVRWLLVEPKADPRHEQRRDVLGPQDRAVAAEADVRAVRCFERPGGA